MCHMIPVLLIFLLDCLQRYWLIFFCETDYLCSHCIIIYINNLVSIGTIVYQFNKFVLCSVVGKFCSICIHKQGTEKFLMWFFKIIKLKWIRQGERPSRSKRFLLFSFQVSVFLEPCLQFYFTKSLTVLRLSLFFKLWFCEPVQYVIEFHLFIGKVFYMLGV